jgi:Tol biopolymer transport system component
MKAPRENAVHLFLMVPLAVAAAQTATAQTTTRVSVGPGGLQSDGPSLGPGAIAAEGRFVAFTSNADNLVPGPHANQADAYVHDLATGVTTRASVSSAGVTGNASSTDPRISGDGRIVAFVGAGTNLILNDTNGVEDIFVRDMVAGTTTRASVSTGGTPSNGHCYFPSVSANGRYVTFVTGASNLAPGDMNGHDDVFVHDLQSGATVLGSAGNGGASANAFCWGQSISGDGRIVAFWSAATNLVAGDTNGVADAFVHDLATGITTRVSVDSSGAQGNARSQNPYVSADGRCVAFWSHATNLVAGDTNSASDVFVHDLATGITTRASVGTGGTQASGPSGAFRDPGLSFDGRFVAFSSEATDLVAGDTNALPDVFVHDRATSTTTRVSVSSTGAQGNAPSAPSMPVSISGDGRVVAFDSGASNLVPGDTNNTYDIFVHEEPPLFASFCSGDGSGTACPCGNAGAAGSGCASSVSASGGHLSASGSASVANDTLVLSGDSMPNAAALFFQGTARTTGGLGAVFGDGLRCAGGTITRLATKQNVAGASSYGGPLGDVPVSVRGMVPAGGGARVYQVWYRNAAPFCTSATFNLSNGLEVLWTP